MPTQDEVLDAEYMDVPKPPPRSSVMIDSSVAPQPAKRALPTLNVERAAATINYFTEHPEWFGKPHTAAIANQVFKNATDVIVRHKTMIDAQNSVKAGFATTEMMKKSIDGLNAVSALIPPEDEVGNREVGRLVRIMKSPDADPEEFFGGVAALRAKYQPAKPLSPIGKTLADKKVFLEGGGTEKEWNDEVESRIRTGAAPIDVKLIEAAKQYREMGDTASADRLDAIVAEHSRLKGSSDRTVTISKVEDGKTITQRMTPSEADAIPDKDTSALLSAYAEEKAALNAGDKSKGPDWLGLSSRAQHLQELKIKLEQKGFDADTGKRLGTKAAPASNAPATVIPMPSDKAALKPGTRYSTPRGEATWDGEKFVQ